MDLGFAEGPAGDLSYPDDRNDTRSEAAPRVAGSDKALLELLELLKDRDYQFVTPTPATHARIVQRPERRLAQSVTDVLGWSLPFAEGSVGRDVMSLLKQAEMLDEQGPLLRSKVRVSRLQDQLFLHSAYPTAEPDAVFFGPDSYRFADLISAELSVCPDRAGAQIVDIGTGSGVGAIIASRACPYAQVRMTDVNPLALRFARINACAAGVTADTLECSSLDFVDGEIDIVTANPPYIIDPDCRLYRDGGGMHGAQVSFDMAKMALGRLAPGGRLILYTGSAIVNGEDALKRALSRESEARGYSVAYRELDPDVFGEELENDAYRDVERIALVAAVITRQA
jgi:methylase of polypeptide subunit release factors